jgi:hypothetical protein
MEILLAEPKSYEEMPQEDMEICWHFLYADHICLKFVGYC